MYLLSSGCAGLDALAFGSRSASEVTVAVAVTALAPGVAGVGHPPGWKHPFPAMVTVVETVKKDSATSKPKADKLNSFDRDDVMPQN